MDNKISVIIPIYNVEAYLPRCLDSVINSTYRNLEIICVNDGSPDGCGEILVRYASMDPRIIVITQENGGISAARNTGIARATGAFLAFVDSDDWVHPLYFEAMLQAQQRYDADIVICDHKKMQREEAFRHIAVEACREETLDLKRIAAIKHLRAYAWGKLYRREIVGEIRFPVGINPEDVYFNAQVFCSREALTVVHLMEALCFYFDRPGSLVKQITWVGQKKLCSMLLDLTEKTRKWDQQYLLLLQAVRCGLSAYYMLTVCGEKTMRRETKGLLLRCSKKLAALDSITVREKGQYILMCWIPLIYRIFRILDDPTLLTWERGMKKKCKKQV